MARPLDSLLLTARLRTLLESHGPQSANELTAVLGISQPSFSRQIRALGADLLSFGKARKTRYALRREIAGVGFHCPLYAVTEEGRTRVLGELHFLKSRGTLLKPSHPEMKEALYYPDLPYFLEDLRPSGVLGRLVPRAHPKLEAPSDIRAWTSDDCIRYWTRCGSDLVGNLILGSEALQRFLRSREGASDGAARISVLTPEHYPAHARQVLEQGEAGSSAGGEQPKFLVEGGSSAGNEGSEQESPGIHSPGIHSPGIHSPGIHNDRSGPASAAAAEGALSAAAAALVKFSPPLGAEPGEPMARRIADLLVCENLCHEILRASGIPAARSMILEVGGQVFLRVERFDRVNRVNRVNQVGRVGRVRSIGGTGRRGIISLRALGMEFVGNLDSWTRIARGLLERGQITEGDFKLVRGLDLFGELIGNSDRHAGNFSFYLDEALRLQGPAPVYDMLPMTYYPRQNQLLDGEYQPGLPTPEEAPLWMRAAELALELWRRAARDARISRGFRKIASRNEKLLASRIEWAGTLF